MNSARRSLKRRDWPRGLREPRPGYYTWDKPDGTSMAIGRVPLAVAKREAIAANAFVEQQQPSLVERLQGKAKTVADVIDAMPVPESYNTAKSTRSLDKAIRAKLGDRPIAALEVRECAELLDEYIEADKARTAVALRSRLMAICAKAQHKGWADSNPAEVTERPDAAVKRGRLTLEQFQAVYAVAPQVAEWLPLAMMLALVTGQDRSTVANMQRAHISDGALTTWRTKTRATNQPVAIPLRLRLDAVGVSLADLVKQRSGVLSKYLVHHYSAHNNAPIGGRVHTDRISHAFTEARKLAGIPDVLPDGKLAPTFHEIRSLTKRLYLAQGNVDTKALLSHNSEKTAAIYADPRGAEPILVRVG